MRACRDRGWLVKLAQKFLLEVDGEIGFVERIDHGRIERDAGCWRRPVRLARVETHDPGQFREWIVVGDIVVTGQSEMGSVCHSSSRLVLG
jgi:hypothetical protein